MTEPSIYAIAQLFKPSNDAHAILPPELHGYDWARVMACITSITDLSDDHQKLPHEPRASSLKTMLDQAALEDRFSSLDDAQYFVPPYTSALTNWMAADQQPTAKIFDYPGRTKWLSAKAARTRNIPAIPRQG
jgi:hypothetical protein